MSTCCKYSYNCGPPECVRERIRADMAARHAFDTNGCCSNDRIPLPHSHLPPWLNNCSNNGNKYGKQSHFFNYNGQDCCERENNDSSFCGKRTPPFWLRNKWMTNNTNDSFGPPKSVILEMLGLKREYLNSKLSSMDSHIAKLKEEIKESTVVKENEKK